MRDDLVFGVHAVEALLYKTSKITQLFLQTARADERTQAMMDTAIQKKIPVNYLDKKALDVMTDAANHQGVIAVCVTPTVGTEIDLEYLLDTINDPLRLLFLDGVQDPHNLGACMRSAYAFGVHAIIAPKDNSVGLTSVARKVACGAAEWVPFFRVTNLSRTIKQCQEKNIWFYGADSQATQTVFDVKFSGHVAWVLGAEGRGLREHTKKSCDFLVKIPMQNPLQSLNVSVACGICLFTSAALPAIFSPTEN